MNPFLTFIAQGSSPWLGLDMRSMSADIAAATATYLAVNDLTPHQADWLITGLIVIAFLIGIALGVKQLFFSKPAPAPPPTPQPLLIQLEKGFVKREEFDDLKTDVHNQIKEMRTYLHDEIHGIRGVMQEATVRSEEQFETLRDKLDTKFEEAVRASNGSASKVHQRLDGLAERQGQLIGEMKHLVAAVDKASDAAQKAALAAASVGGRKSS